MSTAYAERPASDFATNGVWHATPSMAGGFTSHLLPLSWPSVRGGYRPSLCGSARHRSWDPVNDFGRPDAFTPCGECKVIVAEIGITAPEPVAEPEPPQTVRIAPRAPVSTEHHRTPRVKATLLDPQRASAGLPPDHSIFRPRFASRRQPDYTPTAYEPPVALAWPPAADEAS